MQTSSWIREEQVQNNTVYMLEDNQMFSPTAYRIMQNYGNLGFVPCFCARKNGKIRLMYLTSRYRRLITVLPKLSTDHSFLLVTTIFQSLKEIKEYGFVSFSHFQLDLKKIFVDTQTMIPYFICLPVTDEAGAEFQEDSWETFLRKQFADYFKAFYSGFSVPDKMQYLIQLLVAPSRNVDSMLPELYKVSGGKRDLRKISQTREERPESGGALLYLTDRKNGRRITVSQDLVLGRQFLDDGRRVFTNQIVGRRHCEITVRNGKYYVTDLESKNGTYINKKRIPSKVPVLLSPGDILGIVDQEFQVEKGR